MRGLIIILALAFSPLVYPTHLDIDELLRSVKASKGLEGKINKDREARFLAEKSQQLRLLSEARADFAQEERISKKLKQKFAAAEAEVLELETVLKEKIGILGELFGVARQAAGDLRVDFNTSLVSAQFPGRSKILIDMANSKELPTIEQLEELWFRLQQEMTESGKVAKFPAQVMSVSGEMRNTQVNRIGSFNLLADGRYLRYLPETGRIVDFARQPASRYLDLLEDMESPESDQVTLAIDPTRGVILGMLVQAPNILERIDQGGVIGYIILVLGAIGLTIVAARIVNLLQTHRKIQDQLEDLDNPSDDNPLGRVLSVSKNTDWNDKENLELLIDEAVIREIPKLEMGQSLVKLLASVAPLLGLLGTVTGMIATFQSISLFGTGDPKLMAAGISQALVTTMLGLIVAIPLLFLHSLIVARSKFMTQILDEQSTGLISQAMERNRNA